MPTLPLHPSAKFPVLSDLTLLVSRVALGIILLAHGLQKLNEFTLTGTTAAFGDMGVPVPAVAAVLVTSVEILGGVALIVGLLTPLFAALNAISLFGALVIVHLKNGVFVENGGYELVLALVAGLLVVATLGAGKFSADTLLSRVSRRITARPGVTA